MTISILSRAARQARRSGTATLSAYLMLLTPLLGIPACESVNLGDVLGNLNLNGSSNANGNGSGGALNERSIGFFVNSDLESDLLVAGRGPSGDEFFLFGPRAPDGSPTGIETILVRQFNGDESFINFENGYPVYVQGADGSSASVDYIEQSQFSILANVTVRDANTRDVDVIPVSFDGLQTAQQIAAQVERATDLNVEVPSTPQAPSGTGKPVIREQGRLVTSLFLFAFVLLAVNVVNFNTAILGQVLLDTLDGVAAVLQITVLAIFAPFFLIGELLSGSLNRVEFTPLIDIVVEVPSEPRRRE